MLAEFLGSSLPQFPDSYTGRLWRGVAVRMVESILSDGYYRKYSSIRGNRRGRAFCVAVRGKDGVLNDASLFQTRQRGVEGEVYELAISRITEDRKNVAISYIYNSGDARTFLAHLHDGHLPGLTMYVREDPRDLGKSPRYLEEQEYVPVLESLSEASVDLEETLKDSEDTRRCGWKIRWVRDLFRRKSSPTILMFENQSRRRE